MDRSYSPVSPYGRAYESHARSYASKGQKMIKYLSSDKHGTLRMVLGVVAVLSLIAAMMLSMMAKRDYTVDELNGSWSKYADMISFAKSPKGKTTIAVMWVLFVLTAVPFGVGMWYRHKY